MNVFAHVEARIADALSELQRDGFLPAGLALPEVEAETPRDDAHGDIASNIAMVLAKPAGRRPREIAGALQAKLAAHSEIARVDVAGPGFLNVALVPAFWHELVRTILNEGPNYGRPGFGNGEKVNIEYVSANPTGPMHVGHCRGAVFGDALANLLEFAGYDVMREYYINDAGGQVDALARSTYLRYREALGEDIGEIPAGLYPGDYLKPVGKALAAKYGQSMVSQDESQWLPVMREEAIAAMMTIIKDDLAALNIHHDVFTSEAFLSSGDKDAVKAAIEVLRAKGLVYEGTLPRPKGHNDADWEDREQTLFRSTVFGDDEDRALMKSDGSYTYFSGDIAYHYDKLKRGFLNLINVFGADHIGYISRMVAAVSALSDGKAKFDIKICQLVKLFRAGAPVTMSKRAGTFVSLRDVVDEVGRDPVRFMMLYRKNDAPLEFDFAKVTEQSKDNPVFYVQYGHARTASAFRNGQKIFPDLAPRSPELKQTDLSPLLDPGELALIKKLAYFPKTMAAAARAHEPHRLAFYLYELASLFHAQWARGNDSPQLRFIQESDRSVTMARCAMIGAVREVLSSGLAVLGVEAPETMR